MPSWSRALEAEYTTTWRMKWNLAITLHFPLISYMNGKAILEFSAMMWKSQLKESESLIVVRICIVHLNCYQKSHSNMRSTQPHKLKVLIGEAFKSTWSRGTNKKTKKKKTVCTSLLLKFIPVTLNHFIWSTTWALFTQENKSNPRSWQCNAAQQENVFQFNVI